MSKFYYNTNSSNVVEINEKDFNELNPQIRSKYRPATDSEIKLHEKRKSKKDFLDKKNEQRAAGQKQKADDSKKGVTSSAPKKEENTEKKA